MAAEQPIFIRSTSSTKSQGDLNRY